MEMIEATPHINKALADAGIPPEAAHKIGRAILEDVAGNQIMIEKNFFDRVMTKEDGLRLEQRLEQKIGQMAERFDQKIERLADRLNELGLRIERASTEQSDKLNRQILWYIGAMFVAVGAATTVSKLWH